MDILYYYTTTDTMRYILQNGDIYATNLKYMNDSKEYENGLEELRDVLNSYYNNESTEDNQVITQEDLEWYRKQVMDSYSISFSVERDLLSQWSMYAKESGVSIQMNFEKGYTYKAYTEKKNAKDFVLEEIIDKIMPRKVFYYTKRAMSNKQQIEAVEKEIKDIISGQYGPETLSDKGNARDIWKKNIPYIKRYEFNSEGEYRLVFNREEWKYEGVRVDYRVDKSILKPYLDVFCDGGWPVREIIIGPGFNQSVVFESVQHFLKFARIKVQALISEEFLCQCEEFLGTFIKEEPLKEIWNKEKANISDGQIGNNIDQRHTQWLNILKKLGEKNVSGFENHIRESYLSKDGIILRKSQIPYIF